MAAEEIRVMATQKGHYDIIREEGDVFYVGEDMFSSRWMQRVDDNDNPIDEQPAKRKSKGKGKADPTPGDKGNEGEQPAGNGEGQDTDAGAGDDPDGGLGPTGADGRRGHPVQRGRPERGRQTAPPPLGHATMCERAARVSVSPSLR